MGEKIENRIGIVWSCKTNADKVHKKQGEEVGQPIMKLKRAITALAALWVRLLLRSDHLVDELGRHSNLCILQNLRHAHLASESRRVAGPGRSVNDVLLVVGDRSELVECFLVEDEVARRAAHASFAGSFDLVDIVDLRDVEQRLAVATRDRARETVAVHHHGHLVLGRGQGRRGRRHGGRGGAPGKEGSAQGAAQGEGRARGQRVQRAGRDGGEGRKRRCGDGARAPLRWQDRMLCHCARCGAHRCKGCAEHSFCLL